MGRPIGSVNREKPFITSCPIEYARNHGFWSCWSSTSRKKNQPEHDKTNNQHLPVFPVRFVADEFSGLAKGSCHVRLPHGISAGSKRVAIIGKGVGDPSLVLRKRQIA